MMITNKSVNCTCRLIMLWYVFMICTSYLVSSGPIGSSHLQTVFARDNKNEFNTILDQETLQKEYEKLIFSCVTKIADRFSECVRQFNESYQLSARLLSTTSISDIAKDTTTIQRYCCLQNDFKDCWTASIRSSCSEQESRLSKWLPLQVLTDLRTDDRCHTYVLYPHKCRENYFSLWQILAFLLLVPFLAFSLILIIIVLLFKPQFAYESLKLFT